MDKGNMLSVWCSFLGIRWTLDEVWSLGQTCDAIRKFFEVVQSNITYGQLYGNLWQIENGRIFQIGGLFLFGMIAGRLSLLRIFPIPYLYGKDNLMVSPSFVPLNVARMVYPDIAQGNKALLMPLDIAIPSICNFLFMGLLVGCFILLWYDKGNGYKFQRLLSLW